MGGAELKRSGLNTLDLKVDASFSLTGAVKLSAASPVPLERQGTDWSQHLEANVVVPTPEKPCETSLVRRNYNSEQLPSKYKLLLNLFNRMASSVRLLRLQKKSPTFRNIASQVQVLSGRKFEYKHLAQIKYIIPEAIQVRKILEHDKGTMCMNPDLTITLAFDIVEGHHEQSDYIALSNAFASRLSKILSTHREVCDIDEAELPEPFDKREVRDNISQPQYMDVSGSAETEHAKSSHLSASFSRCSSRKTSGAETEEIRQHFPFPSSFRNSGIILEEEKARTSASSSQVVIHRSPVQAIDMQESTPIKTLANKDVLVLETPAQPTPKRSLTAHTCEGNHKTNVHQISMPGSLTAKRSLIFSRLGDEDSFCNATTFEVENNIPGENDLGGTKVLENILEEISRPSASNVCKEKSNFNHVKVQEGNDSSLVTHDQPSVCFSNLILTIHRVFQSVNCRSMTKEELVHKIMMYSYDIDENSDVVEDIEHLEKLLPDWISKELSPSGDLLYNIRMTSDLESICGRLPRVCSLKDES